VENSYLLLFTHHDIRGVWMLHADDVIAGIHVVDFPGHTARHIREQIGARVADFLINLHVRLHIPDPYGLFVTGLLGLAMMIAAVTGPSPMGELSHTPPAAGRRLHPWTIVSG
jgi:uncharacterized iron-regulated membrane protein